MFAASRDIGVRRRSRMYSTNRSARSSKISLLTINTNSSGGSNSTITQESYNRSHGKTSHRRRRTKEHRSRSHRTPTEEVQDGSQAEVFDYLVVNEYDREKSEVKSISEPEVDSDEDIDMPVPKVILHQDDEDVEGYYRSMSDSGISMGSNSSVPSVSGSQAHSRLPALPEEPSSRPTSSHNPSSELAIIDPRWTWQSSSPGPYVDGYIPPPVPLPPHILCDSSMYNRYPYLGYETPSPEPNIYGLVSPAINIREPSDQDIKPKFFRPFSKINARLILQMQDEIAEMEEEIVALDEDSDAADDALEHELLPDMNARRECKVRREHLYEELHGKLDQYYRALEMMQKMENISRPIDGSDLAKHQEWLENRIFPSSKISRLVRSDLRAFEPSSPKTTSSEASSLHLQHLAYSALVNTALPLLAFKLMNGILDRFIFLSIIVVIGASVQGRGKTKVMKDELTCTVFCICISLFAAVCL